MESEVSLVAGRSQREKRRSYKDLLREEEIIDAEVRNSSKKQQKEPHDFHISGDIHKKKKRHEDYLYKDHSTGSHHKKLKRSSESHRSHLSSPDPLASPQMALTAMGLLEAITSPTADGYPSLSPSKERRKEMREASSSRKQPQVVRQGLPIVGEEVELEGHYAGCRDFTADSSGSSSADGSACGKLMIHEMSSHSKKKKKSKKSKKRKDRHREKKHSSKTAAANGKEEYSAHSAGHHKHEEKMKRQGGGKRKSKDKKKVLTAYQIFYKEYRNSILEEEPGLDFGDLSKRLADAWKQLPEGDKQVWRERSEYLQRKQMKLEAAKHVKQRQTSQLLKDSSKPKDHHPPLEGTVSLNRPDASMALSVQNGSVLPLKDPEVDPIDAAAHLQLLGESLSLIGRRLQETEGMVTVSGSLSVLLDSVLCALGPLVCLTTQVSELNGCPRQLLSNTLDNIAYVMPGL